MKAFKEPAKLADRVIAPGDGAAEPGVTTANLIEPAKLATDVGSGQCESHFDLARVDGCIFALAHFVGWAVVLMLLFPRLGRAIAWGYHSVRQLHKLVERLLWAAASSGHRECTENR